MINRLDFVAEQWVRFGIVFFISSFIWSPSRDGLEVSYALFFLVPIFFLVFRKKLYSLIGTEFSVKLLLIFSLYAVATSFWSSHEDIYFFLIQLTIISFWILGVYWLVLNSKINIERLLHVLIYVGAVVASVTVVIFYNNTVFENGHHFEVRLTCWCSARNSNLIGGLYGVLTLISYIYFLSCNSNLERVKYCFLCAILVLPLIFSQSRTALVAFFIASVAALLFIKPKRCLIVLQFLIIAPGIIVLLSFSDLEAMWADRSPSMGLRDIIWHQVFKELASNFLFGIGLSQNTKILVPDFGYYNHAHNSWLDTLYRTGAIGLIMISSATIILVKKAIALTSIEGKIFLLWFVYGLIVLSFDHRLIFWQIDTKWFFYLVPAPFIMGLYSKQMQLNKL